MSDHKRTAIRRLSIRRYRSIERIDLEDLPPLIVLYGPNGSGKSNILRAAQLILRAAARPGEMPMKRERAVSMSLPEADQSLDLRPDDFRFGDQPEIRISLAIDLGTRAREIVLPPSGRELSRLDLEVVFQLDGNSSIRFWFERAEVDGAFSIGPPADNDKRRARQSVDELRRGQVVLAEQRSNAERYLAEAEREAPTAEVIERRSAQKNQILMFTQALKANEDALQRQESALDEEVFIAERVQRFLIPQVLQTSGAYRVPGGAEDPQDALYRAFLSEDRKERDAAQRLSQRLAGAGLFGAEKTGVALLPVDSRTYGEKQIRFKHPTHGDLPLRNLGSGEQQVVLMLGQRVITPFPIAHIEEPEAHLHKTLMEPLARVLREAVLGEGTPDVDQLWIATHHHLFAISEEFFDVSLDGAGSTQVEKRPREEAIEHFYEPHPYWETLRTLLDDGRLDAETLLVEDESGPIRAKDVLSSMHGDRRVANRYVAAATRALVLSLARERQSK
jgi:hypothetical protein